jgi:hypothetical protein
VPHTSEYIYRFPIYVDEMRDQGERAKVRNSQDVPNNIDSDGYVPMSNADLLERLAKCNYF